MFIFYFTSKNIFHLFDVLYNIFDFVYSSYIFNPCINLVINFFLFKHTDTQWLHYYIICYRVVLVTLFDGWSIKSFGIFFYVYLLDHISVINQIWRQRNDIFNNWKMTEFSLLLEWWMVERYWLWIWWGFRFMIQKFVDMIKVYSNNTNMYATIENIEIELLLINLFQNWTLKFKSILKI